jgi:uncharacterized membrane protein
MTKQLLAGWIGTAVAFAVIDLIWLTFVANGFYRSQLGALRADTVNVPAAVGFYLIMVTGVLVFAVMPALKADSVWTALGTGAFLGFLCYATYDLTNLATLRNWPVMLTFVDLAWGTILTAVAASAGYFAARAVGTA